ncbi:hypothetical protein [Paenibacillus solani]|uniref:Uncharacterized protein n=1 Tax=Paenibacillus solani TaxID=1705565 RepID=A0A0M1P1N9_9BACL|nr:hypothetical protein [Paenibacillus solani]KOR88312.1 hypothetical protein AM231_03575 [Paenibacillus solani]
MSRNWDEDMEYCKRLGKEGQSLAELDVLKYWLQQAAKEKKRADELDKAVEEAIGICERVEKADDPLEILEEALIKLQLAVPFSGRRQES